MNRIDQRFIELRKARKKAFIPFLTCGDPDLQTTLKLALSFEQAGADILELGVPFSDPMADGPTIQAASERALKNKVTLTKIIALVAKIRRSSQMPLVLMTYYNPVFRYGVPQFVKDAKVAGVDGVIIPDLPPEEAQDLLIAARKADLCTIFLAAPTSTKERLQKIANVSTGFLYYVSLTGVTGARASLPKDIVQNVKRIKNLTKTPVCVGFGISTSQQVKDISKVADGIIIASVIIKEIEHNDGKANLVKTVSDFVSKLSKVLK